MPCKHCDADVDGACRSTWDAKDCLRDQLREAEARVSPPSLVAYAERELRALPGRRTNDRIMLERDVVALVALFEAQRHSGSSAAFVTNALEKLLRWQGLG